MKKQTFADFERNYEFWRLWNSMCTEVRHFWESICRFFYWGWKMRNNFDWDSGGIYDMLVLKLDRMIPIFENSEFHSYSKKFINRMKLVRTLAQRLRQGDYADEVTERKMLFDLLNKYIQRWWD